jgi:regulator of protease activity HflC (stomatin/prohibitin superfamily)
MTDRQLSPSAARIRPPSNVKISQKLLVVLFGLAVLVALAAFSFVIDIAENFQRIIADRTAKVFAQQNTTTISENRERLSTALKTLLSADLGRLYGVEVVDFQIAGITYSESFRASVEAAVKAKNEAVAAENTVNVSASKASRGRRCRG